MTNAIARSVKTAEELATDLLYNLKDPWGNPHIDRVRAIVDMVKGQGDRVVMVAWLHQLLRRRGVRHSVTRDGLLNAGYPPEVIQATTALIRIGGEAYQNYIERAAADPIARPVITAIVQYEILSIKAHDFDNDDAMLARFTAAEHYLAGLDGPLVETDEQDDEEVEFSAASRMVMGIMSRNAEQAARTHNSLMDTLQRNLDDAELTLLTIREEVTKLFAGPYLPHPNAVLDALYPPDHIRLRYRDK